MSADYDKIKRNIQRMIDQKAPETDIEAYVTSEGVTAEELRAAPRMAVGAPAPEGFEPTTEAAQTEALARTKAKSDRFGGNQTIQNIYDNFLEPWKPNSAPDFSERGIVERVGDATGFAASLPVRMMTQGNYGAGDIAKYLGAEGTGTALEAGERDFLTNNDKQLETVANAGDLAMGLGTPIPGLPRGLVFARRPRIPNPLPKALQSRLSGSPQDLADAYMIETMRRARMTPDQVIAKHQAGQDAATFKGASGALPENIADVLGDAGHRGLRAAVMAPGVASGLAKRVLDRRQRGAFSPYENPTFKTVGSEVASYGLRDRTLDNLARAMGVRSKGTAYQTSHQLRDVQQKQANPTYKSAFENAEPFDISAPMENLRSIAADFPDAASTLKKAWHLFAINRTPAQKRANYRLLGEADDLKRFNEAKKFLDGMVSSEKDPTLKKHLNDFRVGLLNAVHGGDRSNPTLNKGYADARGIFSSAAQMQDAIDLGRGLLSKAPEVAIGEFNALSKGEQAAARLGVMEDVGLSLRGPWQTDHTKFFQDANRAKILRAILPPPAKGKAGKTKPASQFGTLVAREANMAEGKNKALYGSQTAPNIADMEDLTRWAQIATKLRSQGVISTVADEATRELVRVFGMREATAERVARMLLASNPETIKSIMIRLKKKYGAAKAQQAYMVVLSAASNRMRAQAIGGVASRGTAVAYPETQDDRR
jgi:hypothetical protein